MSTLYRSTSSTHPSISAFSADTTLRPVTARPRTAHSNFGPRQQIICAVTESRGVSATVGLCFVNTTNAECILSEIRDSQTYVRTLQKLHVFDPTEILAPSTSLNPRISTLIALIGQYLPHVPITQLPRKYYNEQQGHDYIQQLCVPADIPSMLISTAGKFYSLSSCAAVLKHVELTYIRFAVHALRMRYEPSEGTMLIDFSTVHSLELLHNMTNPKSKDCLFGLLNETHTTMGVRLLRMNILQPVIEREVLELRLDAVEELTRAEEMFFSVRDALKGFPDMDRLCTQLITTPVKPSLKHSEQSINNVIILKQGAVCVQPIFEALGPARSNLLVAIRELCSPVKIAPVIDLVNDVINEDVAFSKSPLDLRNQRCYAVKSGVNGLLDVARQTYKEATEDVHVLVEDLSKEFNLPLELRFENGRGYYLRLHSSDLEDKILDPIFVNVVTRKKFVEFSTLELMKRNAKIKDSLTEVLLMSDKTVQQLISDVAQEVSGLFKVSEGIAMLDMIYSFANLCTMQGYVRPEFTDTLGIKAGRHPIREKIHREQFVPNDVYATQQSRFQIVTGCNMSGKSTYLRTIALITIMAQIGSFVPANYASIPLRTHLFARISTDDSLNSTISTFSAEMREMAFIISNISPTTLVIIDELGRGTSSRDGVAIALAICERLVKEKALVWFATHFVDLAEILGERPGVVGLHMTVRQDPIGDDGNQGSNMTMLYKVSDGHVPNRHYGLAISQFVGLPKHILSRATAISQELVRRKEKRTRESGAWKTARRRAMVLRFYEMLQQARDAGEGMEDAVLGEWVRRLGREFLAKMGAEDGEDEENGDEVGVEGAGGNGNGQEDSSQASGAVDGDDGNMLESEITVENFEDMDP